MLRKSLFSLLILIAYLSSCLIIYNNKTNIKSINTTNIERNTNTNYVSNKNDNEIIGTLTIDKLNLSKDIYNINSSHNNVEENVTILNDDINLIVLAAHSGPGYIAYFDDLNQLKKDDIINLTYKNKKINYKVTNIEEQLKDGTIEINKTNAKRLILTTCSKKDKNNQLVITTEKIDD